MKGLLYKSWLNVKPVATYYIIFVVVFFLVSLLNGDPLYFAAICVMSGVAVPLASMTSDDKDGWEKFAAAAGISRARFAPGRYLFALLCQPPGWVLSAVPVLLCEDRLPPLPPLPPKKAAFFPRPPPPIPAGPPPPAVSQLGAGNIVWHEGRFVPNYRQGGNPF